MDLPPQLLQHITDGLPPADPDDRRRAPRQRHAAWVQITLCGPDKPPEGVIHSVTIWNISPGGAGILVPRQLKQDERIILHLPHPETGQTNILCRVAHVRAKSAGLFLVGLEFERLLPHRYRIPGPLPPLP